ncbi:hypothetical protein J6590_048915 [Homalodisca vitripennis]|nr:hypothetical protein J6590_048915 [Homalodisca vitripennis]
MRRHVRPDCTFIPAHLFSARSSTTDSQILRGPQLLLALTHCCRVFVSGYITNVIIPVESPTTVTQLSLTSEMVTSQGSHRVSYQRTSCADRRLTLPRHFLVVKHNSYYPGGKPHNCYATIADE